MGFDKQLFDKIIQPFFDQILLRNELILFAENKSNITVMQKSSEHFINYGMEFFEEHLDKYFNFFDSSDIQFQHKIFQIENQFHYFYIEKNVKFDNDAKTIFFKLITLQITRHSQDLKKIIDVNLYNEYATKLYDLAVSFKDELSKRDKKNLNDLRRALYLSLHETRFTADEKFYREITDYIVEDILTSKDISLKSYLISINNYLAISLEHYFVILRNGTNYINSADFNKYFAEMKKNIIRLLAETDISSYAQMQFFATFFKFIQINLLKKKLKQESIGIETKKRLLVLCTELIKIFYGQLDAPEFFLDLNKIDLSIDDSQIKKDFSQQLSRLLNERKLNTLEILFIVFQFLSYFSEYVKLNINIYQRIIHITKRFYSRKIYLLSSFLYLKSLNNKELFRTQMTTFKYDIEKNPIVSLITYYNNELDTISEIEPDIKKHYRANPMAILIHEKIYFIKKIIFSNILKFKKDLSDSKLFKLKLDYLGSFQNEMENTFTIINDPNLISDLASLYSFFIDSYIQKKGMNYREDFIQKSTIIKMSIVDINPLIFVISTLFAKLGKLKLILTHKNPASLGLSKKNLTHSEKEEIATFFPYSSEFLPHDDDSIDRKAIDFIIKKIRKFAASKNEIAPPESRIIKVFSAIINKLTRQQISPVTVFHKLYEEAFVPTKNYWDLDPIIIFYLNAYFSRKKNLVFLVEKTGEKITVNFQHLNTHDIYERVYDFIHDLVEQTQLKETDLVFELEKISHINKIDLVENNGRKKNIATMDIQHAVKNEIRLNYQSGYVGYKDIIYLSDIVKNYLMVIGKSTFVNTFIYIMNILINNANKANLKRVHFKQRNLDLDQNYHIGISDFFANSKTKLVDYKSALLSSDLKINISIYVQAGNFILTVSNNFKICAEEIKLIDERVSEARRITKFTDSSLNLTETREGKGLSLIMVLLFLKRFRLNIDSFKLNIKEKETQFIITLPQYLLKGEEENLIAKEIVQEINALPALPDHVYKLKTKLNDPNVNIEEIEELLLHDPSLSADALKISNSALYAPRTPIETIKDAIKIIGFRGLSTLVMTSAIYRVFKDKGQLDKLEKIFQHSEKCAFFAKKILQKKKLPIEYEQIYLASLLHDIGKILIEAIDPDVFEKISRLLNSENQIPLNVIEDLAGGINHALTGCLITQKWNFPLQITEIIRCHHTPRLAKHHPNSVFIVYLANSLIHYNDDKMDYYNLDANVLEFFDLNDETGINTIATELEKAYKDVKAKSIIEQITE